MSLRIAKVRESVQRQFPIGSVAVSVTTSVNVVGTVRFSGTISNGADDDPTTAVAVVVLDTILERSPRRSDDSFKCELFGRPLGSYVGRCAYFAPHRVSAVSFGPKLSLVPIEVMFLIASFVTGKASISSRVRKSPGPTVGASVKHFAEFVIKYGLIRRPHRKKEKQSGESTIVCLEDAAAVERCHCAAEELRDGKWIPREYSSLFDPIEKSAHRAYSDTQRRLFAVIAPTNASTLSPSVPPTYGKRAARMRFVQAPSSAWGVLIEKLTSYDESQSHEVRRLVDQLAPHDVLHRDDLFQLTALAAAVQHGCGTEIIEALVKKGSLPVSPGLAPTRSPLHIACAKGRTDCVEAMLRDVDNSVAAALLFAADDDHRRWSPFEVALENRRWELAVALLAHAPEGILVSQARRLHGMQYGPLHRPQWWRPLLQRSTTLWGCGTCGTLLHCAAMSSDASVLRELLGIAPQEVVSRTTLSGWTCLHTAVNSCCKDAVAAIVAAYPHLATSLDASKTESPFSLSLLSRRRCEIAEILLPYALEQWSSSSSDDGAGMELCFRRSVELKLHTLTTELLSRALRCANLSSDTLFVVAQTAPADVAEAVFTQHTDAVRREVIRTADPLEVPLLRAVVNARNESAAKVIAEMFHCDLAAWLEAHPDPNPDPDAEKELDPERFPDPNSVLTDSTRIVSAIGLLIAFLNAKSSPFLSTLLRDPYSFYPNPKSPHYLELLHALSEVPGMCTLKTRLVKQLCRQLKSDAELKPFVSVVTKIISPDEWAMMLILNQTRYGEVALEAISNVTSDFSVCDAITEAASSIHCTRKCCSGCWTHCPHAAVSSRLRLITALLVSAKAKLQQLDRHAAAVCMACSLHFHSSLQQLLSSEEYECAIDELLHDAARFYQFSQNSLPTDDDFGTSEMSLNIEGFAQLITSMTARNEGQGFIQNMIANSIQNVERNNFMALSVVISVIAQQSDPSKFLRPDPPLVPPRYSGKTRRSLVHTATDALRCSLAKSLRLHKTQRNFPQLLIAGAATALVASDLQDSEVLLFLRCCPAGCSAAAAAATVLKRFDLLREICTMGEAIDLLPLQDEALAPQFSSTRLTVPLTIQCAVIEGNEFTPREVSVLAVGARALSPAGLSTLISKTSPPALTPDEIDILTARSFTVCPLTFRPTSKKAKFIESCHSSKSSDIFRGEVQRALLDQLPEASWVVLYQNSLLPLGDAAVANRLMMRALGNGWWELASCLMNSVGDDARNVNCAFGRRILRHGPRELLGQVLEFHAGDLCKKVLTLFSRNDLDTDVKAMLCTPIAEQCNGEESAKVLVRLLKTRPPSDVDAWCNISPKVYTQEQQERLWIAACESGNRSYFYKSPPSDSDFSANSRLFTRLFRAVSQRESHPFALDFASQSFCASSLSNPLRLESPRRRTDTPVSSPPQISFVNDCIAGGNTDLFNYVCAHLLAVPAKHYIRIMVSALQFRRVKFALGIATLRTRLDQGGIGSAWTSIEGDEMDFNQRQISEFVEYCCTGSSAALLSSTRGIAEHASLCLEWAHILNDVPHGRTTLQSRFLAFIEKGQDKVPNELYATLAQMCLVGAQCVYAPRWVMKQPAIVARLFEVAPEERHKEVCRLVLNLCTSLLSAHASSDTQQIALLNTIPQAALSACSSTVKAFIERAAAVGDCSALQWTLEHKEFLSSCGALPAQAACTFATHTQLAAKLPFLQAVAPQQFPEDRLSTAELAAIYSEGGANPNGGGDAPPEAVAEHFRLSARPFASLCRFDYSAVRVSAAQLITLDLPQSLRGYFTDLLEVTMELNSIAKKEFSGGSVRRSFAAFPPNKGQTMTEVIIAPLIALRESNVLSLVKVEVSSRCSVTMQPGRVLAVEVPSGASADCAAPPIPEILLSYLGALRAARSLAWGLWRSDTRAAALHLLYTGNASSASATFSPSDLTAMKKALAMELNEGRTSDYAKPEAFPIFLSVPPTIINDLAAEDNSLRALHVAMVSLVALWRWSASDATEAKMQFSNQTTLVRAVDGSLAIALRRSVEYMKCALREGDRLLSAVHSSSKSPGSSRLPVIEFVVRCGRSLDPPARPYQLAINVPSDEAGLSSLLHGRHLEDSSSLEVEQLIGAKCGPSEDEIVQMMQDALGAAQSAKKRDEKET